MADRITEADAPRLPERVEWPTLAVAAAVYGGFGLATWFHEALPWWLLLPLGGFLVAWHGSLQHEAARDPESFYVAAEDWDRLGPLGRAYFWSVNTLAGRLLVEPLRCVWRVLASEAPRLARGDIANLTAWLLHLAGAALVLAWALGVCAMPLLDYLLFFAYPGLSLTLLRSFLEHQARPAEGERSVLVEAGWPLSLLFLNNNLHALHHAEPGLAWFKLPERYRARRAELLERNGGYRYGGYLEIAARYLVKPKEHPRHPLTAATRGAQAAPETAPAG
jgi:fatty acid desaturase